MEVTGVGQWGWSSGLVGEGNFDQETISVEDFLFYTLLCSLSPLLWSQFQATIVTLWRKELTAAHDYFWF